MQTFRLKDVQDLILQTSCVEILQENIVEALAKFRNVGKKIILAKGSNLVSEKVHCLEKGKCALCVNDPRGDPISMFYFRPGQMINFLPLLVQCFPFDKFIMQKKIPSNLFHVKALSDCELIVLDTEWFINTFLKETSICYFSLYSCILNLLNIYMCVHNCPILSNAQRICLLLISSIEDSPEGVIPPHLTLIEISRHLSIHSVTVAKIFSKLRNMGIIGKQGSNMVIMDMDRLSAIADGSENITY